MDKINEKEKIKKIFNDIEFAIDKDNCLFSYSIHNNQLKAFFYYNDNFPELFNININLIEKIKICDVDNTIMFYKTSGNYKEFKFEDSELKNVVYHLSFALMKYKKDKPISNIQDL